MYSIQQYCDNDLEPRVSEKPSPDQPLESNVPEQFATTPRKRKRKSPTTLKRDKLRLQKWLATKPFWKSSLHDKQDHLLDTKFQPGLGIQLGEIQEHDQDQLHEHLRMDKELHSDIASYHHSNFQAGANNRYNITDCYCHESFVSLFGLG